MNIAHTSNKGAARCVRNRERRVATMRAGALVLTLVMFVFAVLAIADVWDSSGDNLKIVAVVSVAWLLINWALLFVDDARLDVYREYKDVMEVKNPTPGADGTYDYYFVGWRDKQ